MKFEMKRQLAIPKAKQVMFNSEVLFLLHIPLREIRRKLLSMFIVFYPTTMLSSIVPATKCLNSYNMMRFRVFSLNSFEL